MGIKDIHIVAAGVSIEEAIYDMRYTHVLRVRYVSWKHDVTMLFFDRNKSTFIY